EAGLDLGLELLPVERFALDWNELLVDEPPHHVAQHFQLVREIDLHARTRFFGTRFLQGTLTHHRSLFSRTRVWSSAVPIGRLPDALQRSLEGAADRFPALAGPDRIPDRHHGLPRLHQAGEALEGRLSRLVVEPVAHLRS